MMVMKMIIMTLRRKIDDGDEDDNDVNDVNDDDEDEEEKDIGEDDKINKDSFL